MSQRYSIAEARSRLPRIVDEAEAGVEVELTRRGQPVAVLVSCREFERLRGKRVHFRDAYRKFLKTHSLEEVGVDNNFATSAREICAFASTRKSRGLVIDAAQPSRSPPRMVSSGSTITRAPVSPPPG